jgi:hypothetical protein
MTGCDPSGIRQIAAEAALAVRGVIGLQPTLASRLAQAASRAVQGAADSRFASPLSGIRVVRDPDDSSWRVEVRCVLAEGHRAVDVARTVHDRTRASLIPVLRAHGNSEALAVTVTITRIARTPG